MPDEPKGADLEGSAAGSASAELRIGVRLIKGADTVVATESATFTGAGSIEADVARLTGVGQALADALETPPSPKGLRSSTRKIEIPWEPGTLYPTPNLQGNGTRNLGRAAAGDVTWQDDQNGASSMLALVGGRAIARVDLTPGREAEALKEILERVASPRTIKTMIGISRLIWERTDRKPLGRSVPVRLGELARAAGYEPGSDRHVKADIRHRLGLDLRILSGIVTLAADGPYDPKTGSYKSAWVTTLLTIDGVHLDQLDGDQIPDQLDIKLGRNWAEAYAKTDLVQIAPGFMKLHDDNVIRLGWYYQTEFRYRMTSPRVSVKRSIRSLCSEAGIDTGVSKHRGRFLERLDKWHAELLDTGVIGEYHRDPAAGANVPPGEVFACGEYTVRPPQMILDAYKDARAKASSRTPKRNAKKKRAVLA